MDRLLAVLLTASLGLVVAPGCDDGGDGDADGDGDTDGDADADTDGDADADGDVDGDADADGDADPSDGDSSDADGSIALEVLRPTMIETLPDGEIPTGTVLNAIVVGESIEVEGSASGGEAPYALTWRSSIDGVVGTGSTATLGSLSEGDHDLVLEATDALGSSGQSAPFPLHVLPPAFDWSHVRRPTAPPEAGDWMTPVRNQATCGSCWAFAALAVVEAQYNIQSGDPDLDLDLSEQWLIDCDTHSVGCGGGGTQQALEGYLHEVGAPVESCDPFLGGDDECLATCRDGSAPQMYRVEGISQAVTVPGGARDATQAWMRYQLVHHGPIARAIVYMYGYDPVTHTCAPASGDHYVAVVGFDHADHLWIAKNSWGSAWNGDGYFEIAYGECAVDVAATIVDAVIAP